MSFPRPEMLELICFNSYSDLVLCCYCLSMLKKTFMSIVFMVISFVKVYYFIACAEGPTVISFVNCVLDFQFSELLNSWFAYPCARNEKTKILVC